MPPLHEIVDRMSITDFLTVREICEMWRVDPHFVLGMIHRGELRASDISPQASTRRRWRIARGDFEKFMAERAALQEA